MCCIVITERMGPTHKESLLKTLVNENPFCSAEHVMIGKGRCEPKF